MDKHVRDDETDECIGHCSFRPVSTTKPSQLYNPGTAVQLIPCNNLSSTFPH